MIQNSETVDSGLKIDFTHRPVQYLVRFKFGQPPKLLFINL